MISSNVYRFVIKNVFCFVLFERFDFTYYMRAITIFIMLALEDIIREKERDLILLKILRVINVRGNLPRPYHNISLFHTKLKLRVSLIHRQLSTFSVQFTIITHSLQLLLSTTIDNPWRLHLSPLSNLLPLKSNITLRLLINLLTSQHHITLQS